jgi:hypothetical protein
MTPHCHRLKKQSQEKAGTYLLKKLQLSKIASLK